MQPDLDGLPNPGRWSRPWRVGLGVWIRQPAVGDMERLRGKGDGGPRRIDGFHDPQQELLLNVKERPEVAREDVCGDLDVERRGTEAEKSDAHGIAIHLRVRREKALDAVDD